MRPEAGPEPCTYLTLSCQFQSGLVAGLAAFLLRFVVIVTNHLRDLPLPILELPDMDELCLSHYSMILREGMQKSVHADLYRSVVFQ